MFIHKNYPAIVNLLRSSITFLALCTSLLLPKISFSQNDVDVLMKDWIGEWEGTYIVTGGDAPGTAKENIKISVVLKNSYLNIHEEGEMAEQGPDFAWASDYFITYDYKTGNLVGVYITMNSGADLIGKIKGELVSDNKFVITSKCNLYTWITTWELKEGKLYRKIETKYKDKSKNEPVFETVFSKKK